MATIRATKNTVWWDGSGGTKNLADCIFAPFLFNAVWIHYVIRVTWIELQWKADIPWTLDLPQFYWDHVPSKKILNNLWEDQSLASPVTRFRSFARGYLPCRSHASGSPTLCYDSRCLAQSSYEIGDDDGFKGLLWMMTMKKKMIQWSSPKEGCIYIMRQFLCEAISQKDKDQNIKS